MADGIEQIVIFCSLALLAVGVIAGLFCSGLFF